MATAHQAPGVFEEIAEFLAAGPSQDELLNFRPSKMSQRRVRELLERVRQGRVTDEEQEELDQFEHAELLMRLIKARLHATKATQP